MQTLNTEIPTVSYVNQCQIWGGWKHTVLEIERREKKDKLVIVVGDPTGDHSLVNSLETTTGSGDRFKELLNLRSTPNEGMFPEAISWVLDELDERY